MKEHKPVLLGEDNVHYKGRPPYILIGILIFIILSGFWKVHMAEKNRAKKVVEQTSVTKTIP